MSRQAGECSCATAGGNRAANSWWEVSGLLAELSRRLLRRLLGPPHERLTSYALAGPAPTAESHTPRADGRGDSSVPSPPPAEPEWTVDRPGVDAADLSVGDTVTFVKELTEEDVRLFARSSGDTNPLHLDEEFATGTRFDGRIVHGALLSGLVSAAIARLPGVPILLSQDTEYLAPARPGESLTGDCEIVEDVGDRTYRLRTRVTDEADDMLVDGEAVVLVDEVDADDQHDTT